MTGTVASSITDSGLDLTGRVALVTGGSAGIGFAIARRFTEAGARVVIAARKEDRLREAAKALPGEVAWCQANVSHGDDAERTISFAIDTFGALDVLVNNAATNPYFGPTLAISQAQAQKTMDVNVFAALRWTQIAAESSMLDSQRAAVVNIASVGAFITRRNIGFYNATKAALVHLTRQLADELGPSIRVNAVAPGLVRTEMARALWEPREAAVVAMTPLGRLGEVDDVANAVLFLASDLSSWMTGQTLVLDGGASIADPTVQRRAAGGRQPD